MDDLFQTMLDFCWSGNYFLIRDQIGNVSCCLLYDQIPFLNQIFKKYTDSYNLNNKYVYIITILKFYKFAQQKQFQIFKQAFILVIIIDQVYKYINWAMQSKYRKLYLYASNHQSMVAKKLNQTSQQYALKKQKSIEHLKQLLDIKISLPPVSELSFSGRQKNGQANQGSRFSPYKIKRSKAKILKANNATSTSFLLPLPNQNNSRLIINPDIRKISKSFNLSKKYAEVSKEAEREIKYQKYINQYMQSLQKSNLLQKIPQQQYKNLVQQACKQIKRKIIQDQNLIRQVQKGLEESNDEKNLRREPNQKSISLLKSSPKAKRKKLQILQHLSNSNEGNYKSSILKLENKLILKQNNHKKSKSVADNNLYKLTLQNIQKINELKSKQRKRSQKQFVRHLTKSSFAQSHHGFKPQ